MAERSGTDYSVKNAAAVESYRDLVKTCHKMLNPTRHLLNYCLPKIGNKILYSILIGWYAGKMCLVSYVQQNQYQPGQPDIVVAKPMNSFQVTGQFAWQG
jgi:hypothetical protein